MLLAVLLQLQGIPLVLRPRSTGVEGTGQLEPRGTGHAVEQDTVQGGGGTAGRWRKQLWVGSQGAAGPLPLQVA